MFSRILSLAAVALLCISPGSARADAPPDVVMQWNAIMVSTVSSQNPFAQARIAAITQLAVFDAVNAIAGDYEPYLDPISAPVGASTDAAAVAAAYAVLNNYVPAAATALGSARASSLAQIADGQSKVDGIAVGEAAAAQLIAARSGDGSGPPQFHVPASSAAGEWQVTPSCPPAGGILLHWRNVDPFGVNSSTQFRAAPPPSLSSPQYARDYEEVLEVGAASSEARSSDRADVARLYASLLAVGVWNTAAQQIADADPRSISEHARVLALLNMSLNDALVTSFETKYHYRFWRPETAIRAGETDGNDRTMGDADFAPFIAAPCFPSYPSAHASGSYAGRAVLERVWGSGGHSITLSHPAVSGVTLNYSSLKQITDDIDDARVFGGIHFRFDQDGGAIQGRRVAQFVSAHSLMSLDN
jgi:hypothetical protein